MKIFPSDAIVQAGQWVNITCRVPCALELNGSHTFKWFVGDHRFRNVGHNFEQRTGIKVEMETVKECKDRTGEAWHRVRVFASSAERINRTPVQCAALRKSQAFISDYYSYFAVILVEGKNSNAQCNYNLWNIMYIIVCICNLHAPARLHKNYTYVPIQPTGMYHYNYVACTCVVDL